MSAHHTSLLHPPVPAPGPAPDVAEYSSESISIAETPAENCRSVVTASPGVSETTPELPKRAGATSLGSPPRQISASVVSAGQRDDGSAADSESVVASVTSATPATDVGAVERFFAEQKAAETDAQRQRAEQTSRVFSIMQYEAHPESGAPMYGEELILRGLDRKSIRRAAWIRHDRDRRSDGTVKPPHWHVVLLFESAYTIRQISDWFTVPSARVRRPDEEGVHHQGPGAREKAFFDLVKYLVHENGGKGELKTRYDRDAVKTLDGDASLWDDVDAHMAKRRARAKKAGKGGGRASAEVDELVMLIQEKGWTKRQARRHNPLAYSRAYSRIEKARAEYLVDAPLPAQRTNYYIGGPARSGKSTLAMLFARALATTLYPDLIEAEAIYQVGRPSVAFQDYDGQPILIWDDYRPLSIIEAVGGDVRSRDSLWPVLDIAPKRVAVNKKYGSATLLNAVNIITGIQSYREFLDGLAGEFTKKGHYGTEVVRAEDKNQAYGRFPFVSEVTPDTIKFYLNRGFSDGGGLYQEYEGIARIRANMRRVIETIDALPDEAAKDEFRDAIGARMLGDMVQAHIDLSRREPAELESALAALDGEIEVATGFDLVMAELNEEVESWRAEAESCRLRWAALWPPGVEPPHDEYTRWMDAGEFEIRRSGGMADADIPPPPRPEGLRCEVDYRYGIPTGGVSFRL